MTTKEFALELKQYDKHLSIRPAAVSDMEGVYYDEYYITGIPANNIYDDVKSDYQNELGTPHKTRPVAIAQIRKWIENKEENIEIEKDFAQIK